MVVGGWFGNVDEDGSGGQLVDVVENCGQRLTTIVEDDD